MEGANLAVRVNLDQTSAPAATSATPGQSASQERERNPRRPPPTVAKASAEPETESQREAAEQQDKADGPPHRIDSLA